MFVTIIAPLILLAIPALVVLAYTRPREYEKLWPILVAVITSVYLFLLFWDLILYLAQTRLMRSIAFDHAVVAVNALREIEAPMLLTSGIYWVVLAFLAALRILHKLRDDGRNSEGQT